MTASKARKPKIKRAYVKWAFSAALATAATLFGFSSNKEASAYGDTRTISLYYTHTKDTLNITYKQNGYYDRDALKQLSYFLRDWRRDEPTTMDPKLFDVLWEVYREAGYEGQTINVVSAYRSPETNGMLRRRSRAVAKHSQHMLGKAMDTTMPGVSMSKIREIGVRLQRGGVGYYPTAGTPFVHLDVGSVRAWPRLNTNQLVSLFPDQKTVHVPSDGPPLAGYQAALADIERNGGSVGGGGDEDEGNGRGLFAALFGGGSASKSASTSNYRSSGTQVASINTSSGDDAGARSFFLNNSTPERANIAPINKVSSRLTRVKIEPRPVPVIPQAELVKEALPIQAQPLQQIQLASFRPKPVEDEPLAAIIPLPPRPPAMAEPQLIVSATASLVPMPPRRPTELVALANLSNAIPLPPLRPTGLSRARMASLGEGYFPSTLPEVESVPVPPIIMGKAVPKSNALGFAASETLVQSKIPAQRIASVNFGTTKRDTSSQNVTLETLMSKIAVQDNRAVPHRVEEPQIRKLAQSGIVATKFESSAVKTLESGKFTAGLTPSIGASFIKASTE